MSLALQLNNIAVDLGQPRYVVSMKHRKLMLLDLHGYRCYNESAQQCEAVRSVKQILKAVCKLRDDLEDNKESRLFCQTIDQMTAEVDAGTSTIAELRKWYLQRFPRADQ